MRWRRWAAGPSCLWRPTRDGPSTSAWGLRSGRTTRPSRSRASRSRASRGTATTRPRRLRAGRSGRSTRPTSTRPQRSTRLRPERFVGGCSRRSPASREGWSCVTQPAGCTGSWLEHRGAAGPRSPHRRRPRSHCCARADCASDPRPSSARGRPPTTRPGSPRSKPPAGDPAIGLERMELGPRVSLAPGHALGPVQHGDRVGDGDEPEGQPPSPASSRRKPSSSSTGTPSSCAFASLEPAFSPATT